MVQQVKEWTHATIKAAAATRQGAWLFARIGHPLDGAILAATGGRLSLTKLLSGIQVVQLTCTGAKSGLPRTLPLGAIIDPFEPQKIALIASNWGQRKNPAWYYNLKANPRATITTDDGRSHEVLAHEAVNGEYERYWTIANNLHGGYQKYQERNQQRKIPIMVLEPLV
ncbi:MAG: nitroreductase family deazaflavin-dependent oxidoreductase [Candidatus Promineifilaceae bacterium]|nr:nitroreductase family deazaflavin-dependent oxidoreductase [Candidatus Promineifilaceae bacterium]